MSQLQLVHWMHNEVKIQIEHVAGNWIERKVFGARNEMQKKNGGEPLLVVVERVMVNDADCAESEQEHKQFPVADLVQRSFEDKKLLG